MIVRICVERPLSEAVLATFVGKFPQYDRLSSAKQPTVEHLEFIINDAQAAEFQKLHREMNGRGGKITFYQTKTMVPDTEAGASS